MNRRFFTVSVTALLAGCSGAGVTSTDLRGKVAAEVATVVVNREQLAPWVFKTSVEPARLDAAIATVRQRTAMQHAATFEVLDLHDLRRFYSSVDGQTVVALAYAQEGGRDKLPLNAEAFDRVELALRDPVIARSVSVLRGVLREAFRAEFAFA